MFKANREIWMIVAALAVLVACFAPASFAGERLTASLAEPFEFDGNIYSAGQVMLYELAPYSPGAILTELRVEGRSAGLAVARDTAPAATPTRDELIFERTDEGLLVLSGVALAGRSVMDIEPLSREETEAPALLIASAK